MKKNYTFGQSLELILAQKPRSHVGVVLRSE